MHFRVEKMKGKKRVVGGSGGAAVPVSLNFLAQRAAVMTAVGPFDARQSHLYAAGRSSLRLLSYFTRARIS